MCFLYEENAQRRQRGGREEKKEEEEEVGDGSLDDCPICLYISLIILAQTTQTQL